MKDSEAKKRMTLIKKLKANTIYENKYDQLHIRQALENVNVGSVLSASNKLLEEALSKDGFIC